MKQSQYLLQLALLCSSMFFSGCMSLTTNAKKDCYIKHFLPLPYDAQSLLGVKCEGFETDIPEGYTLTLWSELYQYGKLNKNVFGYHFRYNSLKLSYDDKMRVILFRRDTDAITGETTKKAIWGFACLPRKESNICLALKGDLVLNDPKKSSTGSCGINILKLQKGVSLTTGKPTLICHSAYTTGKKMYWYDIKAENIEKNDHVIYIYGRLDKGKIYGGYSGGGRLTSSSFPYLNTKEAPTRKSR